jgi:CHAD domain-containing protein
VRSSAEREVKLTAGPDFTMPPLDGVADGITAVPAPARKLDATYYDTSDLRLARWGITVRYRKGDGDGWTVKLPEGDDGPALVRREVVFDAPNGAVPPEVLDLLRAYVRSSHLRPVVRITTLRRATRLQNGDGAALAEVVDDAVAVYRGSRVTERFREIEVELESDDATVLGAVAKTLQRAGADPSDPRPKAIRALGSTAQDPPELVPIQVGKRASAGDVLHAAAVNGVIRFLRHEPGVRLGDDPEDVHQARVAIRRLRSDLRTFRDLGDAAWLEPLRDELGWLGRALGAVRDADVLLDRLRAQAESLPDRDAAGVAALVRRLFVERDAARTGLLEVMASPRYVALLDRLVEGAQRPVLSPAARKRATRVVPPLVATPWRKLAKAAKALGKNPEDAALHQVRIQAKRCRYAAEAVAPVVGKPATKLADAVAEVQTVLGDHQDAVVAEAWLREAGREGGELALVAGELVVVQRAQADASRMAWKKAWKRASHPDLRRWLP